MSEKFIRWAIIVLLLLVVVTMGGGILFIYRQFPRLDNYSDTRLVSQNLQTDYALSICLATINQQQTFYTSQSDGTIWQRVSEQWTEGESRILGNGGEAQFQRNIMPFVTIRSRLFFLSANPHNTVFVNNQLILQLPDWLCHPSGNSSMMPHQRHAYLYEATKEPESV